VAGSLVEVLLSRLITDGKSLGDGSRRNGSRLELDLGAAADVNRARVLVPQVTPALHQSPVSRVEIQMHQNGTTLIVVTGNIANTNEAASGLAQGKGKKMK
jgi:hypothetical protein